MGNVILNFTQRLGVKEATYPQSVNPAHLRTLNYYFFLMWCYPFTSTLRNTNTKIFISKIVLLLLDFATFQVLFVRLPNWEADMQVNQLDDLPILGKFGSMCNC